MHPAVEIGLRVELTRFVTRAGRRRSLAPTCLVGHPAGEQSALADAQLAGQPVGIRTDLVVRALDGLLHTERACAWVTRSGDLEVTDSDAAWLAAARAGFARHGVPLEVFAVVNRTGWTDLVGGDTRTWSRVRPLAT